jgi:HSP20 family protein
MALQRLYNKNFFMDDILNEFFEEDFINPIEKRFNNLSKQYLLQHKSIELDFIENDKKYIINASLPGFDKNEIDINLQNNKLTISANKKNDKLEETYNYVYRESSSGQIQRSINIPKKGNIESITCNYKNGILEINIPKKKSEQETIKKLSIH